MNGHWLLPLPLAWVVASSLFAADRVAAVSVPGTGLAVNLSTQVGDDYDARAVANDLRYLWSLGRFEDIRVETAAHPDGVAVVFRVTPAPHLRLHEIRIEPHSFGLEVKVAEGTPIDRRRAHDIALEAQRMLIRQGYPAAQVQYQMVPVHRDEIDIKLKVAAGKSVRPEPRQFESKSVCAALFLERREAQRRGVLDYSVKREDGQISATLGPPYRLGRLEFTGNHHYGDAALRRTFLLDEGDILDERVLRRSMARLNRTGWFETLDARKVVVDRNETTGFADVTVHLTERRRGSWKLSGPVGPATLAGPLEVALGSRLPPWGRGVLNLGTYTASIGLMAFVHPLIPILNAPKPFTPIFALQRPFTPVDGWLSGFSIAPQLGWHYTAGGYVTTQLEQRLHPRIAGERGLETEIEIPDTEGGAKFCRAPAPRLAPIRTPATILVHVLATLPTL